MDASETTAESFEEFKNSFSYGSRSNLSFKFLKQLPAEEAGEFFHELVNTIAASYDHGNVEDIHHLVNEWQIRAYTPGEGAKRTYVYEDGPFTPLTKPLSESRVALITSSGHFVAGDDPMPFGVEEMSQQEAEDRVQEFLKAPPDLSEIPVDTHPNDIRVRHGGYHVDSAAKDHNVAFPLDPLIAAAEAGRISGLVDTAFSFSGATSQGRLRKQALPGWIERFKELDVDVMLLVPV